MMIHASQSLKSAGELVTVSAKNQSIHVIEIITKETVIHYVNNKQTYTSFFFAFHFESFYSDA
jgi:hypothetical protein